VPNLAGPLDDAQSRNIALKRLQGAGRRDGESARAASFPLSRAVRRGGRRNKWPASARPVARQPAHRPQGLNLGWRNAACFSVLVSYSWPPGVTLARRRCGT